MSGPVTYPNCFLTCCAHSVRRLLQCPRQYGLDMQELYFLNSVPHMVLISVSLRRNVEFKVYGKQPFSSEIWSWQETQAEHT